MSDDIYYEKYLKYKNKYLQLKNQEAGAIFKFSYALGYMLMTPAELEIYEKCEKPVTLSKITAKDLIPTFKLTKLNTLNTSTINFDDWIKKGTKKANYTNYIDDEDFLTGDRKNPELNKHIIDTYQKKFKSTLKDNKTKLVIFTLVMPYVVYPDFNSKLNFLSSHFVLKV
jgi:hypothetical protein